MTDESQLDRSWMSGMLLSRSSAAISGCCHAGSCGAAATTETPLSMRGRSYLRKAELRGDDHYLRIDPCTATGWGIITWL